jgi:hypothetical protein
MACLVVVYDGGTCVKHSPIILPKVCFVSCLAVDYMCAMGVHVLNKAHNLAQNTFRGMPSCG